MSTIYSARLASPIGTIEIVGNEEGIQAVEFLKGTPPVNPEAPVHASLQDCLSQLQEYFEGKRKAFDVKLNLQGTEFQLKVWNELLCIPYGKTTSYLRLAVALSGRTATRAVGSANGRNPVAIIVPCHRVIGSSGELTGYAGGLWRKEWLLQHEGVLAKNNQMSLF